MWHVLQRGEKMSDLPPDRQEAIREARNNAPSNLAMQKEKSRIAASTRCRKQISPMRIGTT